MPPKVTKKRARTPESDESDRDDRGKSSAKKSKTKKTEDQHWALSKNRRITVNEYNKQTMVNIREYYEQDGEMKPGKKGISLNLDQYKQLRKHLSAIDEELLKRGEKLDDNSEEDDDASESDAANKNKPTAAANKKANKKSPAPKKANIEATSDEESG